MHRTSWEPAANSGSRRSVAMDAYILQLPFDIQYCLFSLIFFNKSDLKQLRLVHRSICSIINPVLFDTITATLSDKPFMLLETIRPAGPRRKIQRPYHLAAIKQFPRTLILNIDRLKDDEPSRFPTQKEFQQFVNFFPSIKTVRATISVFRQANTAEKVVKAICGANFTRKGTQREFVFRHTNFGADIYTARHSLHVALRSMRGSVDALKFEDEWLPDHVKGEQAEHVAAVLERCAELKTLEVSTDGIFFDEMLRRAPDAVLMKLKKLKLTGRPAANLSVWGARKLKVVRDLDVEKAEEGFWMSLSMAGVQLDVLRVGSVSRGCLEFVTTMERMRFLDIRFPRFSVPSDETYNVGYVFWRDVVPKLHDILEGLVLLPQNNIFLNDRHEDKEFDALSSWDPTYSLKATGAYSFPVLRKLDVIVLEADEERVQPLQSVLVNIAGRAPQLEMLDVSVFYRDDRDCKRRVGGMVEELIGTGSLKEGLAMKLQFVPWSTRKPVEDVRLRSYRGKWVECVWCYGTSAPRRT